MGLRPHGRGNQQIYKLTPTNSKSLAVVDVLYFLSESSPSQAADLLHEPDHTRAGAWCRLVKVAGSCVS